MKEEVRALHSLDHSNIVKIHEHAYDVDNCQLVIVLEYISGGSCRRLLQQRSGKPLPESFVAHCINQVLSAVAHSHSRGVVHRDLKPEHMMLTSFTPDGHKDCKLIDFGLAACGGNSSNMHGSCALVGTPAYMAPEVVDEDRRALDAYKADVWSVGIIVLELLIGKNPFHLENRLSTFAAIRRFRSFDELLASHGGMMEWNMLSPMAQAFVRMLLVADPWQRPSASQAMHHPWLMDLHGSVCLPGLSASKSMPNSARPCETSGEDGIYRLHRSTAATLQPTPPMFNKQVSACPPEHDKGIDMCLPSCYGQSRRPRPCRSSRSSSDSPPATGECNKMIRLSSLGSQALARLGG